MVFTPLRDKLPKLIATPSDDCILWHHTVNTKGYGHVWTGEKLVKAHRLAYELQVGTIPEGHLIDHECHTPACINPRHLKPALNIDNTFNRKGANTNSRTGVRGVSQLPNGRYGTLVHRQGKRYTAGTFPTLDEAATAVAELRESLLAPSRST